jgi:predicted lipid-binding transport protein (Tim44 family)
MKLKTTLTIVAILFLVSESAFARAGGRSSSFGGGRSTSSYSNQGSRGARTYDGGSAGGKNYSAMDKSTTAKPSPSANQNANQANNFQKQNPNPQPSFFQRNPLASTFGAALAGSWIGSMLFGSGAGAMGMGGANGSAGAGGAGGGMFSGLMPILLIGLLVWLAFKFINRNKSSGVNENNQNGFDQENSYNQNSAPIQNKSQSIELLDSDRQKFVEILNDVQAGWSNQDIEKLKKITTPEITKYFSDALHQNQSQNLQNKVEKLQVMFATVSESWEEDELQYATIAFEWSALDYTINTEKNPSDSLYVTEGDMNNPTETSEAWTFVRYGSSGKWILSAIAQVS